MVHRRAEHLKVLHPLGRKSRVLHVGFGEDEHQRQVCLVEHGTGVEHVAHERGRVGGAGGVHHIPVSVKQASKSKQVKGKFLFSNEEKRS